MAVDKTRQATLRYHITLSHSRHYAVKEYSTYVVKKDFFTRHGYVITTVCRKYIISAREGAFQKKGTLSRGGGSQDSPKLSYVPLCQVQELLFLSQRHNPQCTAQYTVIV